MTDLQAPTNSGLQAYVASGLQARGVGGNLWVWGDDPIGDGTSSGQQVPTLISVATPAMLSAGQNAVAIVDGSGQIWYWGPNSTGALGNGTTSGDILVPTLSSGSDYAFVSTTGFHTLAVTSDGTGKAWGSNGSGRLGDGTTTQRLSPVAINGGHTWAKLHASNDFSLGLTTDGDLYGWGENRYYRLGDGTETDRHEPVLIGTGYTDIWAYAVGGLALKGMTLYAWGRNQYGEAGQGTSGSGVEIQTPTAVAGTWATVVAGTDNVLALTAAGALWAWGRNSRGEHGNGTTTLAATPTATTIGTVWTRIAMDGGEHMLAVDNTDALYAWGANGDGQLGVDDTVEYHTPQLVDGALTGITLLGSGARRSVALAA